MVRIELTFPLSILYKIEQSFYKLFHLNSVAIKVAYIGDCELIVLNYFVHYIYYHSSY
nr:MAG TPA: hypothetical protein [Caudoviricetes sp.]